MIMTNVSGRPPRVHFSGIGGTGMVAGARLALEAGWEVRGSDTPLYPPTSDMVAALGVPVAENYCAANLEWGPDVVVLGNALSRGNPEVEAALERRLHYVSLAEFLKDAVLRRRRPIAICGTHGKTSTTALTAFVLDRAGLAPGYFVGGQPQDFPNSARLGADGAPFVIEGDEYDTAFFDKRAKFFHYLPEIAVVTSVEFDHGDIYPSLADIERAFQLMLRQVPPSGRVVLCADQPGALALRAHAFSPVTTYGLGENAEWRGVLLGEDTGTLRLAIHRHDTFWGETVLPPILYGRHMVQNALATAAVADALGASQAAVLDALGTFRGVKRRMEVFHNAGGITFVDDFAHHPTAIAETIRAARQRWTGRRVLVLFEPRSNTTVTNRFQEEFPAALAQANAVWIGPLFRAERLPENGRLDRGRIVDALRAAGVRASAEDSAGAIVEGVKELSREGDVVLVLSNGAFDGIYGRLRTAFPTD